MKALIDGDTLVYRCAFAAQHWLYLYTHKDDPYANVRASFRYKKDAKVWLKAQDDAEELEESKELQVEPVANCLHSIKHLVEQILEDTKADEYIIYLGGEGNFRLDVDSNYKANRKDTPKPIHYQAARDYLINNYDVEVINGMEADDALGIAQYSEWIKQDAPIPASTVICTIDKDLDQIPGAHYNPTTQKLYHVDELNADLYIQMQLLTGDSTDNIPGIKGIGEKRAYMYLDGMVNKEAEDEFIRLEYKRFFGEKDIRGFPYCDVRLSMNKQLITILREPL